MRLILASQSPRRQELLAKAGFSFETIAADIDETPCAQESVEDFVVRMAREKASTVAQTFAGLHCLILAADTVVTANGLILGKPRDSADAKNMLETLSGNTHEVITGYALHSLPTGRLTCGTEKTTVTFRVIGEQEILAYIRTGEPMDKAGAYAIQGLAGNFVTTVNGSHSNVVGLPMEVIGKILHNILGNPH